VRRFQLQRHEDVTGVSGTGIVAEGVEFSTGKVVLQWLTETSSVVIWGSIEDAIKVHGHGGLTELVWVDKDNFNEFTA